MSRFGPTYSLACEMQRKISSVMLDPDTDKRLLSQLALAWDRLEERKRILRRKPLVKPVDVSRLVDGRREKSAVYREPDDGG